MPYAPWAPSELVWRGQFFTAYVGRDHGRAPYLFDVTRTASFAPLCHYEPTEVVSMGLEAVGGGEPERLGAMLGF